MHDVDPEHRPLAPPSGGDQAPPPLGSDPGGRGGEHGVRGQAGAGGDYPRDTRPDRATRWLETSRGLLSNQQLAPLLAARVALAEADLFWGHFSACPLDEDLVLDFHVRVCGELVPEWVARWPAASAALSALTLEFLAVAEGRFLTVHPFRDSNGRTIRLFLLELLRRLDLPHVVLAPQDEPARVAYLAAFETADCRDWRPLMETWRERFARADTSP
jgi:hypothetical protein